MFLSLLTTLVVLGQAPLSPGTSPLTVLIAPPDAAGVPSHIVAFTQEHVYEQLKTEGLQVVRASELSQGLPPAQRKAVLGCNRLEAACRISLGEAAVADVVMITELVHFLSGYRVGLKAYATRDGELLAEYFVPGVRENQLLDAFTQASTKVVPPVLRALRSPKGPSTPGPGVTAPPTPLTTPGTKTGPSGARDERLGPPQWAWMPAAGGAVALGLGTVLTVQAHQYARQLREQSFGTTAEARSMRDAGARAQTLGAVAFVLGTAGVATTSALYLMAAKKAPDAPVRPTVSMGPTGGMVGVMGTLP